MSEAGDPKPAYISAFPQAECGEKTKPNISTTKESARMATPDNKKSPMVPLTESSLQEFLIDGSNAVGPPFSFTIGADTPQRKRGRKAPFVIPVRPRCYPCACRWSNRSDDPFADTHLNCPQVALLSNRVVANSATGGSAKGLIR